MKKVLSALLSAIMLVTAAFCVPIYAFASYSGENEYVENPFYSEESVAVPRLKSLSWTDEAAPKFRDALVARSEEFSFEMPSAPLSKQDILDRTEKLFYIATSDEISVSSVDGDYIKWQVGGWNLKYSYNSSASQYTITLYPEYYCNASEEKAVDYEIKEYLATLNFNAMSDYEILKEFHDYILDICDYNDYDMDNDYNYSSYGVFCRGLAVCQGYALAFYRLCKEAGFDVRFVSSDPNVGCHAWNLVYIGDAYYYVDCTWDDDMPDKYSLFLVDYDTLQSYDSNYEHLLESEYTSDSYFINNYNNYASNDIYDSTSKSISNCRITVDYANPNNVTVTDKDYGILTNSVNYTITQPSDAFVKVNGLGDYAGTSSKRQASINNIAISLEYTSTAYDTYEKRPAVYIGDLTYSADFAVSYSNNINAGTAQVLVQGTGKFTGVRYLNFNINQADINSFNISLSFYEVYYNYVAQLPQVSAYPLVEGRDYIVEAQPQTQVGTGYVYVKGINNCTGTAVKSFTVKKKSIAGMSITLNRDSFEYSGYEIKPSVYISGLIEGADYDVTYSSNVNVGTGYVTITGKGIYEGTVTKSFTIYTPQPTQGTADNTNTIIDAKVKKPRKATIKKLKSSKKSITVYWKKLSASGYQIEYSTSSKFKNAKRITVSSGKKTSTKISKLKKGKKYYIRVRAYKTSNGKRIYGAWSAKKSIVCK